jgi:hypothetical protein
MKRPPMSGTISGNTIVKLYSRHSRFFFGGFPLSGSIRDIRVLYSRHSRFPFGGFPLSGSIRDIRVLYSRHSRLTAKLSPHPQVLLAFGLLK